MSNPEEPPPPQGPGEVSGEVTEASVESPPIESQAVESYPSQPYPSPPTQPVPMEGAPNPYVARQSQPYVAPPDDSILPATANLQEAVGSPAQRRRREPDLDDIDTGDKRWNRRTMAIAGGTLFVGIGIVALVFLGRANADRYLIACSSDKITPEQGRAFPPWGSRPLTGPEWKPIALPPNAECTEHEVDTEDALGKLYLDLLVDRASTALTAKNLLDPATKTGPAPLDAVSDQLNQALLLARAPERRDQRKELERLQGDVQYWRATARLRDANAALLDASKQFDAAAAARPRHVSDAGEWAGFLRKLTDELHAGPGGTPEATAPIGPPTAATTAPAGTALPVEPEGSASPQPAPIDAGLPSGGVLL